MPPSDWTLLCLIDRPLDRNQNDQLYPQGRGVPLNETNTGRLQAS